MDKMVKINIDGKVITAARGDNLLQVARDNGIDIPGLCYHRKLSPTGACRLCVTKIEGQRGLVMACTVSVEEGMKVIAFDSELEQNRKHTLEYLLAEHNDESDDTYHDEMALLTERYGLTEHSLRSYPSVYRSIGYEKDETSPVLTYDASKCIKCFRCIKACQEVQGKNVLSFSERGIGAHIVAGFDHWSESECDGCGECVQLCPTGALVEKLHRDEIRLAENERTVRTTCPYCGVGCQIEAVVQGGTIVRVNGVEGVLPNDGRLCVKGRFGYDFVSSPKRLRKPLIKKDGGFVEATWDEALNLIARRFGEIKEKYGPESLAGYASSKCTNEDNYIFQKFVRMAFGNNNVDNCARLCHASTVTALLKSIGDGAGSNSIQDFELSDCLFVTGNNIIETHPVTATYVKAGKRRGQKLIVCDPRWTPLVKYADLWLQPRLGSDVALLNGMMRQIIHDSNIDKKFISERVDGGMEAFGKLSEMVEKYTPEMVEEITSVPAEKLIEAARIYSTAATAMIVTGMGMSQQVTGTHNVFSLINMMLITGNIGREQCGIDPPRGQNNVQGASDVGCTPTAYPGYRSVTDEENRIRIAKLWKTEVDKLPVKPGLTTVEIMKAAGKGEVKGVYIMGENPMVTDPDLAHTRESLEKLEFVVVQDIFLTETTPYADVILPAASFAEKEGTFVNSDRRVLRVRKVVDLPGEAREDWRILVDLADRMGVDLGRFETGSQVFDEIASAAPILGGVSYDRIEHQGLQWPCPTPDHPGSATLFIDRFNTPNGRAKLNPVEFAAQTEKPTKEFPFILNSGRILYQYHSATMSRKSDALNSFANESYLLMNREDADLAGLKNGEKVKVMNERGELETVLCTTGGVARGEIFMPWHFSESLVNKLTRSELDPFSKIAPFKLSACRVEKA